MPLIIPKESKSAATIRRRRRHKVSHGDKTLGHKSDHVDVDSDLTEEDPEEVFEEPNLGSPLLNLIMSSDKTLFLGLAAFRVVNALIIQTSYVPDEYWQSVEVAHKMTFGYGYLTWEWRHGLRGYTYPLLISAMYKMLALIRLDTRILLIKAPRIAQGLMAAVGDLYLFRLSYKLSGQQVAQWSLLCQLTSWFTFYCCTRTLTNSVENVLTTVALYYFPWPHKPRQAHWKYVSLVGIAVLIRPTAAILWLPLCVWHAWMYRHAGWKVIRLFVERGCMILALLSIVDRIFYGKWVFVHYNFLQFNVFANMGSFYGSHPWHWYLTQGLAVILGSHVLPFLLGARRAMEKPLLGTILWTVLVYSALEHKEFRFLFPVLPMAMHIAGCYIHSICDENPQTDKDNSDDENDDDEEEVADTKEGDATASSVGPLHHANKHRPAQSLTSRRRFVVIFLIVTNLPLALYTCLIHQRGTLDVMKYLHDDVTADREQPMDVMFLMPCHSTPYYSYIHKNISMRFLTCEPNLSRTPGYVDEADIFYQNPLKWLDNEYLSEASQLPTHLVTFDGLKTQIVSFLSIHDYYECARFFHSHVPEGRVGSHVVVYCRRQRDEKEEQRHNYVLR